MIPKSLVIARYFEADKKAIESLESERDDFGRQMEEMEEETAAKRIA